MRQGLQQCRGRARVVPLAGTGRPTTCCCWRPAQQQRGRGARAAAAAADGGPAGALIIEADGALADLHMDGHRVAFNRAFHELGMDCANWTPAIYHDLLSKGDGTGEGLVAAYYQCVGWPTFLPTNEQGMFAERVHALKQKHFKKMVDDAAIPLRDGVTQVLQQALAAGFRFAVLGGTASQPDDAVAPSLLQQLPPDVVQATVLYAAPSAAPPGLLALESGSSAAGGPDEPPDGETSLEASLAAAATRLKRQGAQEFVRLLSEALEQQERQDAARVQLDPVLRKLGTPRLETTSLLSAIALTQHVPTARCIMLASSLDLINAAAAVGMLAVAIPRKMAYSATYQDAAAKFEGFGPGAATFSRLHALLQQRAQAQPPQ